MSLQYDYSQIPEATKEQIENNKNAKVAVDCLIQATVEVGLQEITKKNLHEFFARLYALEQMFGAYRLITPKNEGESPEAVYFTYKEVECYIGLRTNADNIISRAKWLQRISKRIDKNMDTMIRDIVRREKDEAKP